MFVVPHERRVLFDMPHLKVLVPPPEYLLAMKVLAARANTEDAADIGLLIRELGLQSPAQVLDIVRDYYPDKQVKPAAEFLLDDLFARGRE